VEKAPGAAHIVGMVQVWKSGEGDDFTCPECGAVYAVTIRRFPARDSDDATCGECKKVMAKWNSTASPSFTLKIRRDGTTV